MSTDKDYNKELEELEELAQGAFTVKSSETLQKRKKEIRQQDKTNQATEDSKPAADSDPKLDVNL